MNKNIDMSKFDIREGTIESKVFFDKYDKYDFRYSLERVWNKEKEDMATIILFNPSYADEYKYDYTSMKVINFLMKQKDYKGIYITNLYPIIMLERKQVKGKLKEYKQEENNFFIKQAIKKSKDIYIGWGSHKDNKTRIREVIEILKENNINEVYELLDEDNNQKHISRITIKDRNKKTLNELESDIDKVK